jgi:sodium/bile acid cotransporter 7
MSCNPEVKPVELLIGAVEQYAPMEEIMEQKSWLVDFFSKNWFVLGLVSLILFSFIFPGIGYTLGFNGVTADVTIVLIFLITGLTLPSETILSRLSNIKLHIFIQIFIFIFIPLYVMITAKLLDGFINEWTMIGLYATAVLPTTISSNIVFTQASGGNVVATTFNAALANVMGIFISPLLLSFMLRTTGSIIPLEELLGILKDLVFHMLLPIIVGQVIRIFFTSALTKYSKILRKSTSVMILIIVFLTISKAVKSGLFNISGAGLPLALIYLALSHLIFLGVISGAVRVLKFSREDRISALFTAPQKTLAMGAPLLSIFFASRPELLAASIVPLSFYHLWQLIVAGFIRGAVVKE